MALTSSERVKLWRERQKAERLAALQSALTDIQAEVFKKPFFETDFDGDFDLPLSLAGIIAPTFDDDRGPKDFVLNGATDGVEGAFASVSRGSLGRAEVTIGSLIDSAVELARHVNRYKRSEIEARIAEIEARDLSDPETKKAAFKDMTRLNKMLDQLDKQVRWTFPQWKVTG
jgi:hypothetical protein